MLETSLSKPQIANLLTGYWEGTAIAQGAALAVGLYFEEQANGLQATIDFPTWNSIGYLLSHVHYEHPALYFEIAGGKAPDTFTGKVTDESIAGELTLWGRTAQVQLQRKALQQPYRQEEVAFGNHDITIAGTLLLPTGGSGPYPAVVLIAGSGAETRDKGRGMAVQFVRQGLAALIYDKRGTGSSTGDWQEATFADLAQDVLAAIDFLKRRTDIQPTWIGLHGTSQGGWIAHLAASLLADVAFVITVASPAVTPAQQVLYEVATRLRQKGFGESEVSQAITLKQQFDQYVRSGANRAELESALASAKLERWFSAVEDLPDALPSFEQLAGWRAVLDFDPLPYVQHAKCRLLAVFGERDAIVNSQESALILQQLTTARSITVKVFERANHSLMVFPEPHEPFRWFGFADHYLETVISWVDCILKQ